MFGLSRVIKKTEVVPAVEIIDVDRAIERFEHDEEVVTLCTEISAILYYQSRDRATGDDRALERAQKNLTDLLAQKRVCLESSDINSFVAALSTVEA